MSPTRFTERIHITLFSDIVLFARAMLLHGSDAQKRKYMAPVIAGDKIGAYAITEPEAGSDAFSVKSSAIKKGNQYILNGSKTFTTNAPIADYFVVIVRTEKAERRIDGGTWFILERGMQGLSTSPPLEKLGMRSSPTGQLFMDDVTVSQESVLGEEGKGFRYMVESLDVERVMEGASTIGIAQACLENSVAYANERKAFGRPIAAFQLIQEKISDMAMGIDLSRSYLYHLCELVDQGSKITKEAAILKLYSSTMAVKAAQEAIQIMGGYGYMEENRVARYFRDAKHHEIGAGTSEVMKLIIARETLRST
jgi:alkylation response protein AidB-like acyl-CoA dehydrogenase